MSSAEFVATKEKKTAYEMARDLREARAKLPAIAQVNRTTRFIDSDAPLIICLVILTGFFIGITIALTSNEDRTTSLQSQVVEQAGAEGYFVRWGQDDIGAYPNVNFANVTLVKDSVTTKGLVTIDDKDAVTVYQVNDDGNFIKLND